MLYDNFFEGVKNVFCALEFMLTVFHNHGNPIIYYVQTDKIHKRLKLSLE